MSDTGYINRAEAQKMLAQARLHEAEKVRREMEQIIFARDDEIADLRSKLSDAYNEIAGKDD